MRQHSSLILALSLALTINSCAGSTPDSVVTIAESRPKTDFTAELVNGGTINLQTELNNLPVALWFWAPG